MPNWCENDLRIKTPDTAWLDGLEECLKSEKGILNYIRPNPSGEWSYDWSVTNWGTKWDATAHNWERTDKDEIVINFDSAWSPPLIALEHLLDEVSKTNYADFFTLELHYYEPGMGFVGYFDNGIDEYYDVDPKNLDAIPEWLRDHYNLDEYFADFEDEGEDDDQA